MSTVPLPFPHTSTTQVGPVVPLPAGVRIDRFVVEKTLHQGAHGCAYLVRESGHHVPLVLLECFPRALAIRQPDGAVRARQAGDAIALSVVSEAFVQDARALAAIQHPGVVKVFGTVNANRTVYRLMPYVEGQTLEEQRLERPEPPTLGGLVRLYDKLLDAIEAVHGAGFVHGYVQPDQILMRVDDNAPVLLGMDGVAMELGEVTMSPWAAPEQQQSTRYERINTSADLYMLAATMYFAATGAAPPRAEERLAGDPWDPAVLLAEVPLGGGDAPAQLDHFIQAVAASLVLAPAARPQRADDVRHILHPRGDGGFVSSTGPVPLWVGEMPDRDSQWETLEGMSGPAPLKASTGPVPFDDDTLTRPAGAPVEPTLAPMPVRHPPAVEPVRSARRRVSDAATPRPRVAMIATAGAALALLVAGLAWYSQRPALVPMVAEPGPATALPPVPAAPSPPPVTAARPAPAQAPAATPAPVAPPERTATPAAAAPAPAVTLTPPETRAATPTPAPSAPPAVVAAPAPAPAPAPAAAVVAPPAAVAPAPPPAAPPAAARTAPTSRPSTPAAAAPRPPAAAAPRAATRPAPTPQRSTARPPQPDALCGSRTQFAYLYCMQEQCSRAVNRNNAQCAALRRSGDLR